MKMNPGRRAVAAALAFLAAAFLAGVSPGPDGIGYRTFGLPEGILAILLTHTFLRRGVWWSPPPVLRWVAIAYGTVATAQLLGLLLPSPGVLEWLVLTGVAFSVWGVLGARTRTRLMMGLATMALLLSILKFSVIPVLWVRAGPGPGEAWGLGDMAEGLRRLVVDYEPVTPAAQLVGFVALGCWALGTRLLWRQPRRRPKKALR
ncbi:MAG TPA: hypothetical protein VFZ18_09620 [Longimicrobiaceae bacterium]